MGGIGVPELMIIFLVVLLVFGAKRIPEIARGLGQGIKEFKDASNEIKREITAEESRPTINRPKQGSPAARGEAETAPREAPPEPVRADNPGAAEAEQNPS